MFQAIVLGMTGLPLQIVGALVEGTEGAEVSEVMTLVAGLIVPWMTWGERSHLMSSSPHGLNS
jgi:hypothetical protein